MTKSDSIKWWFKNQICNAESERKALFFLVVVVDPDHEYNISLKVSDWMFLTRCLQLVTGKRFSVVGADMKASFFAKTHPRSESILVNTYEKVKDFRFLKDNFWIGSQS